MNAYYESGEWAVLCRHQDAAEEILQNPLKLGEPVCLAPTGDVCGEGVLWHRETQTVYWTDINRFLVHAYSLKEGTVKTWFFDQPATCVMETDREGTLALSLGSGIFLWRPGSDGAPKPLFALPGWPSVRCNDAAVDPSGAVWVGSMRNNVKQNGEDSPAGGTDGILYRVDGVGSSTEWRHGLGCSNTLLWSGDQSIFYFGDTLQNCIWSYDCDLKAGSIRGERPFFHDFDRGLPDGSAIDKDGYIWNCRYDGGCIVRVAPNGDVDQVIEMPVGRPTNCTFGGPDGNVLFVTCAAPGPGKWERFGGGLFALETNTTGVAENLFLLP